MSLRNKKPGTVCASLIIVLLLITSCSVTPKNNEGTGITDNTVTQPQDIVSDEVSGEFKTVASAGNEENADTYITLDDNGSTATGDGVYINGSVITLNKGLTYSLSGTLSDGQILIDTADTVKTTVIFNGVNIHCSDSSPINIISQPKKAELKLTDGSVNIVSDGEKYALDGTEECPTAAIYSKADLELSGTGELYVTGNYNKGIFSKDDLEISECTLYVTSADDGIRGKDLLNITSGIYNIKSGADGLRTSNETDDGKGNMLISGGTFKITAAYDGIQSVAELTITGGSFDITSGGGSANASDKSDEWGSWDRGGRPDGFQGNPNTPSSGFGDDSMKQMSVVTSATQADTDTTSTSAKGIKSASALTISQGSFTIDSSDDSLHSNADVNISGGSFNLTSGDDGIHSDTALTLDGCNIDITKSYEGIEGFDININSGTINVVSSDDGLNAAGGNDNSSVNGRPGQNGFRMNEQSDGSIVIKGGYLTVNASGDGIDSNGMITMDGGTAIVFGPTNNGNGALDYNSSFAMNGGTLLATGSSGMSQSVSKSVFGVLSSNLTVSAESILNITDNNGNSVFCFISPKSFSNIVFCSQSIKSSSVYTVISGGTSTGELKNGVYTGGSYSGGSKVCTITAK